MPQVAVRRFAAKRICKARQALAEITLALSVEMNERIAEGVVLTQQPSCSRKHRREMLRAIDPMNETVEAATKLGLVGFDQQRGRLCTQGFQHPLDASSGRHGIAKGEARCDETDDLLIPGLVVPVNEIDRISAPGRLCVTRSEQLVEAFADTVHFAEVLAILPSLLQ
jgi:hypothetical protein